MRISFRTAAHTLTALSWVAACGTRQPDGSRAQRDTQQAVSTASAGVDAPSCYATGTSMTPTAWKVPALAPLPGAARGGLQLVREVSLPGPANRFDYQSIDSLAGRLYISHMNAGRLVVVDLESSRVVADIGGVDRATGVWAVPAKHRVFVSAAGRHELIALDEGTLKVVGRVSGIRFPDGIGYAPDEQKLFVSDESGEADVVVDAGTVTKRTTIALGGEAGNTHYDSVSHCIVVAVQTRNQLVAIDPATERIVARYDVPGSDHPHGFTLDEPGRLAFVSSEGSGALQVVDLRTMRVVATHRVGDDPDVLAWDPQWRRLYVASEPGVVSTFAVDGAVLRPLEEFQVPHAHTIAVDPRTHRVYLPLENLNGRPVLRILAPSMSANLIRTPARRGHPVPP
jgi:DNA-binding beta-propeller fold protein YncE